MARYAVADLHGHYELYKAIKDRIKVDDLLYVLGDCADRGPDGWKTLSSIIEDPQCILLMGNHEWMLKDVMEDWYTFQEDFGNDTDADEKIIFSNSYSLLLMNGGEQTFWDWRDTGDDMYMWYRRLTMLPLEYQIFDSQCGHPIGLSHAGYTPWLRPTHKEDFVWDRHHFFDEWEEDAPMGDYIIIHGHTPQEFLVERLIDYGAFYDKDYKEIDFEILDNNTRNDWNIYNLTYADGHKICIDPGTIISKKGLLLNLDTLEQEVRYFRGES